MDFVGIKEYKHGDLFQILLKSYKDLIVKYEPKNKIKYLTSWKKFDDDAFNNPHIGKCVFISLLDGKPIGLFSYDPRHFPEYGVIGQNCIIKKFRFFIPRKKCTKN